MAGMDQNEMVAELNEIFRTSSDRAKLLQSDNIYHILNYGAIRLMKNDLMGAKEFYDQVISMDPVWSAFAHYNRAYCTLKIKNDGYIRSAIADLKNAVNKLEAYKEKVLLSDIYIIYIIIYILLSDIFSSAAKTEWDDGTVGWNNISKHCHN